MHTRRLAKLYDTETWFLTPLLLAAKIEQKEHQHEHKKLIIRSYRVQTGTVRLKIFAWLHWRDSMKLL